MSRVKAAIRWIAAKLAHPLVASLVALAAAIAIKRSIVPFDDLPEKGDDPYLF